MNHSENQRLPIIPLRDQVVFPQTLTPLFLTRTRSLAALERAGDVGNLVLLVTQKIPDADEPQPKDLFSVGVIGEVHQTLRMPDNTTKILVEGKQAVRIRQVYEREKYLEGLAEPLAFRVESGKAIEALKRAVLNQFETFVRLSEQGPDETYYRVCALEDACQLAHAVASHLQVKAREKQAVLGAVGARRKLLLLNKMLGRENELLELQHKILSRVRTQIGQSQKEHFLSEQMRAIEKELGLPGGETAELDDLRQRLHKAPFSKEAREKASRELTRLTKMPPLSPESTVSRTYVEWLLDVPWGKLTHDRKDLDRARKILEADHYGLTKVKERILEFLAVRQLVNDMKGPILCFVGPPGVGKTSLARSIARTLGRRFVRVSLGGIRDEAEIRGHRRTYVGSLPGKVVQSLVKARSMNPVFLLDEVDKMGTDFRGDPASALLEALDPEQNRSFNDHYLEIDLDLSRVLFITTANTTDGIPPALLDRMESIELAGYTEDEKRCIARQFLIPKQLRAHGLTRRDLQFAAAALQALISAYTREAGVRNLEREIATVIRKVAKEMVSRGQRWRERLTPTRVRRLLGPRRFDYRSAEKAPEIGLATGLAWTEVGGELLHTEATVMRGKGELFLTGNLGEIMQESAKAALSYIRSRADSLDVPPDFYKNTDIHIHVPEGAIPKDGPSAGVAMATSVLSALSQMPVRQDIAMTGEITLRGKILKIGGLKEKVLAAHRARIGTVVIPRGNKDDLEEISDKVRRRMRFVLADDLDDVIEVVLLKKAAKKPERLRARPSAGGRRLRVRARL